MATESDRKKHLAKVMDPEHVDIGLFIRFFMDFVRSDKGLKKKIKETEENAITPWTERCFNNSIAGRTVPFKGLPETESKAPIKIELKYDIDLRSCLFWNFAKELYFFLESLNKECFYRFSEYYGDRVGGGTWISLNVDVGEEYKKLVSYDFSQASYNVLSQGHEYVNSPRVIIREALLSIKDAMLWACSSCQTPDEIMFQMNAMLLPTIEDPRRIGKKISPIEMLGYGNNGDIGVFISDIPCKISDKEIIKLATKEDPSIVHPDFVAAWFSRKLEIGGCPALVHRSKTGEIYMDFAQFFVEIAKKIKELKDRKTNADPGLESGITEKPSAEL